MSYTYFSSFTASSIDGGIALNWGYNNSAFTSISSICVYVSDNDLETDEPQTYSLNISPYMEDSTTYTNYFEVPDLINGKEYIVNMEVTVLVNNALQVESTNTVEIMPSGIPPVPLFTLKQKGANSFTVNLVDASGDAPTPLSTYDNYSKLTIVYVVYNVAGVLKTVQFNNDASNSLYYRDLTVTGLGRLKHEVNVKIMNVNGTSALSPAQKIQIENPIPDSVRSLVVKPNIFVDVSANVGSAQNRLTWTTPSYIGDPSLNSYKIYRDGVDTQSVVTDASATLGISHSFVYLDSGLVAGQNYEYTVYSINGDAVIPTNVKSSSATVRSVIPATMKPITKTPSDGKVTLDVSANLNGFAANEVTFDVSMNGQITNYAATNFDIIGANVNGTIYNFQVRAKSVRTGDTFTTFNSAWSNVLTSMPYAPVESITGLSATPVDASLNPLNGKVRLSWTAPANASYRDPSFNIAVYRKLVGSVDASYVAVTTTILQGVTSYEVTGLTNGTAYTFKVVKRQTQVELNEVQESAVPTTVNATPFARPSAITNLQFADASMAYSFTRSDSSGGLTIDGYELNLVNISNGLTQDVISLDLIVRDASLNLITSGNVLSLVEPGRQYRLAVRPFVTFNGAKVYSESAVTDTAFSTPTALAAPTVVNVDNGVPMNGQLKISWVLNAGFDASNVQYDVFNGASRISLNQLTTTFTQSGLSNGLSQNYAIVVKIGGLSSPASAIASNSAFNYVPVVTSLASTVISSSAVTLNWVAPSVSGTGVTSSNIRYRVTWTNSDLSGQIQDLTGLTTPITGLTAGHLYNVNVFSGVLSNGIIYYSPASSTIQITPYASPAAPTNVNVYPSDNTFLVDCDDAPEVSGLTFKFYRMSYGLNNVSPIVYTNPINQEASLFYQNGVANNSTYSVKLSLVYWNELESNVVSLYEVVSPTVTTLVTPLQGPGQPSNPAGESIGNNQVKLSWDYGINTTNYSIYKDSEIIPAYSHIPIQNIQTENVDGTTKLYIVLSDLVAGNPYNFKIVAEQLLSESNIYVSSAAGYAEVTPYSTPSAVTSLRYIPTFNSIDLSWNIPNDQGGADAAQNGSLQYSVEVWNSNGSIKIGDVNTNLTPTYTVFTNYVDASAITQTLSPSVQYTFKVFAFFRVGPEGSTSTSKGPAASIVTQLRRTVNTPVLTLSALDTTGDGKSVQLALQLDPSGSNYTIEVSRNIFSPNNSLLGTVNYTSVTGWSVDASNIARLTDGPGVSNIAADSNNFLNGNTIRYQCKVTYSNWSVNYSPVVQSSQLSIVPSGKPIFSSLAFDASKNLTAVYSRNGANINSVTAIGISTNDNGVQVLTPTLPLDGSNNQINGSIARNQQVTLRILTGEWNNSAEEALFIVAGVNGTVLKAAPATNSFVNLSS
jgi:hypothetical protein